MKQESVDKMNRRQFVKSMAGAGSVCLYGLWDSSTASAAPRLEPGVAEARYYEKLGEKKT